MKKRALTSVRASSRSGIFAKEIGSSVDTMPRSEELGQQTLKRRAMPVAVLPARRRARGAGKASSLSLPVKKVEVVKMVRRPFAVSVLPDGRRAKWRRGGKEREEVSGTEWIAVPPSYYSNVVKRGRVTREAVSVRAFGDLGVCFIARFDRFVCR